MGFIDLVKENGAQFILIAHLNHLVQFELPKRLYLEDFSPGFTVCLLWFWFCFFFSFFFWITLVVRPKSLHFHWVTHFLWPGLGPCHLLSWLPVANKSWGLLSTRTDTSLPFHTTVFQCLYFYRSILVLTHSKVVFWGDTLCLFFRHMGSRERETSMYVANLKYCYITSIQFLSWAYKV